MASVVSRGGNWPVEDKASPMGSVIFLSAEDDDADTLKPRLLAHGADIEMITTVNSVMERQLSMSFSLEKDAVVNTGLLLSERHISLLQIRKINRGG